eukprot:15477398-Alexandrium_andersonii.AAC.1
MSSLALKRKGQSEPGCPNGPQGPQGPLRGSEAAKVGEPKPTNASRRTPRDGSTSSHRTC